MITSLDKFVMAPLDEQLFTTAPFWAHQIYDVLQRVTTTRKADGRAPNGDWQPPSDMPYCVQGVTDGQCVILNRKYKPLGVSFLHAGYVDYNVFPSQHVSRAVVARWEQRGVFHSEWYLHNDGNSPRHGGRELMEYRARLLKMIAEHLEGYPFLICKTCAHIYPREFFQSPGVIPGIIGSMPNTHECRYCTFDRPTADVRKLNL